MKHKVAVVADVIMEYGGAEKVTENLLKMFPKADLYTLFIVPAARKKISDRFPRVTIHTSPFQAFIKTNRVSRYISVIKIISWIYWELLNLKKYNLIISSSHSFMSKNVKKGEKAFHLSYIHTPPRYLHNEFSEIRIIKKFPLNILLWPILKVLKWIDRKGATRPDIIVVNSKNVRQRVKDYYKSNAVVVYPPVEVKVPKKMDKKKRYYVCLSRLVKQKGIDLAVKTCTENNLPLVVVGDGGELPSLRKIAGPSIKFIRKCGDIQKFNILSQAKALIYTSREEDFGIVPVEALKLGIPVIAYASGGVKESVIHRENGVLFKNFNQEGLIDAMKLLENLCITKKDCMDSAKKYSFKTFSNQLTNLIPR